jgi:hypothetical protein
MSKDQGSTALELLNLLQKERHGVLRSLFSPESRIGLIELIRAVDNFWVGGMVRNSRSEEEDEIGHLILYSLPQVFDLFLDTSCKYAGAPLFRSTSDLQQWADSVLQHCGRIGYCMGLLKMSEAGLCKCIKVTENEFHFRLIHNSEPFGVETYDKEHYEWIIELIRTNLQQGQKANLRKLRKIISRQMAKRVNPWRKYYIQYTTTPEIDIFYQHEGLLHTQTMVGNDTFPREASFGGIQFGMYCAAVATLVGWGFKHLGFCLELLIKAPSLDPRNIQTITSPLYDQANSLSLALELDYSIAVKILEALTLTAENKVHHCSVPGNPVVPLFVEIGENQLLLPLYGGLTNPFFFLLRELHRRYPGDWDRAVNGREEAFRKEVYDLFPSERFYRVERTVKLKDGGKTLTDIDAFVFDRKTKLVGVFQLKWQDFFGANFRQRQSQKDNLLQTGNEWINRVSAWISNSSPETLAMASGLNLVEARSVVGFKLFVLGRHAAHFSGAGTPDPRAAWGQWYQFVRIAAENYDPENPIEGFYSRLQADSPLTKAPPQLTEETFKIGDVKIVMEALH